MLVIIITSAICWWIYLDVNWRFIYLYLITSGLVLPLYLSAMPFYYSYLYKKFIVIGMIISISLAALWFVGFNIWNGTPLPWRSHKQAQHIFGDAFR